MRQCLKVTKPVFASGLAMRTLIFLASTDLENVFLFNLKQNLSSRFILLKRISM